MGGMSIWHWIVVGIIVLLLFGRGKVSELMGDVAKGIKSFKKEMNTDEAPAGTTATAASDTAKQIEGQAGAAMAKAEERKAS